MAKSEFHRKIFYHPGTLKIMGMSDGEKSLGHYPHIAVEQPYHSTSNLKLEKGKDGQLKVTHKRGTLKVTEADKLEKKQTKKVK